MIDPFHLEAYGVTAVNYNRDVEAFPIVRNILSRITGDESVYKSPTDMGVNMAGYAIVDDEAVRAAASQEIIRRYYKALCDHKQGKGSQDAVDKIKRIMQELSLTTADRAVVAPALAKSESCRRGRRGHPAAGRTDRNGQGQQPDERLRPPACSTPSRPLPASTIL